MLIILGLGVALITYKMCCKMKKFIEQCKLSYTLEYKKVYHCYKLNFLIIFQIIFTKFWNTKKA